MDEKIMGMLNQILEKQMEMSDQITGLKVDVADVKTDVAGLKDDVVGLKTDVGGLKTDVADLKTDVGGLKTDVGGLKTDVGGLKTDVGGLKTDVADLKTDVGGLKTDVADLKTDVAGLKTEMAAVKSRGERNTMLLEQTEQHISIFGEGLASFREQVDRQFEGVHVAFDEKIDILETVIKSHSSMINTIKDESKHMQGILGEHEVAIRTLKNQTA